MLVEFGRFGRPHGVRGEVRFWPYNPDSPLLVEGRTIRVGRDPRHSKDAALEAVRFDPKGVVVKLARIDDRDTAAALTHQRWYEPRDAFPPAEDDEIYVADLIGLTARTHDGIELGKIIDVLDTGPTDVLVIRGRGRTQLVPNVADFVRRMDLDRREVIITPIDGLLDTPSGGA